MKRFLKIAVGIGLLALAAFIGAKAAGGANTVAEEAEKIATAEVARGTVEVIVTSTGTVKPSQTVEVKSKAGGEIINMPYGLGDMVEAGALILELEKSDEERAVARAEAQVSAEGARLEAARNSLELARSEYDRFLASTTGELERAIATFSEVEQRHNRQRELLAGGSISQQEFDRIEVEYLQTRPRVMMAEADLEDARARRFVVEQRRQDIQLAEANLESATITRDEAKERLAETHIVSPIDGTITKTFVLPGQVISSAISNVGGGTTLLEVSDLSRLLVDASIDEVDIGALSEGQAAVISADAHPNDRFDGVVRTIAPSGEEVNSVVVFTVRLEIRGEGLERLRPGMTVNVSIEAGKRDDVLRLPVQAVVYDDDKSYIIPPDAKDPDDQEEWKQIDVGLNDGLFVEILGGLEEGETVRLPPKVSNRRWKR